MSKFDENLFGRIAVLNNYISKSDLEGCLERQRSGATKKHIGHILLEAGHLSQDQFNRIVEIRNKKMRKLLRSQDDASENDREFARLALRERLLDLNSLEEAVLEQHRLRQFNLYFSLAETLISRKQLNLAGANRILALQGRSLLRCAVCDAQYRIFGFKEEERYSCPECDAQLEPPVFLDPLMVDGVVGSPPADSEEEESVMQVAFPETTS